MVEGQLLGCIMMVQAVGGGLLGSGCMVGGQLLGCIMMVQAVGGGLLGSGCMVGVSCSDAS